MHPLGTAQPFTSSLTSRCMHQICIRNSAAVNILLNKRTTQPKLFFCLSQFINTPEKSFHLQKECEMYSCTWSVINRLLQFSLIIQPITNMQQCSLTSEHATVPNLAITSIADRIWLSIFHGNCCYDQVTQSRLWDLCRNQFKHSHTIKVTPSTIKYSTPCPEKMEPLYFYL